ncbi:MAG: glutathione S-transferase family protein [Alphaproteobacteria bacterium]
MVRILGRKTSTNVQKVLWCFDELGVACEREDAGGPFGRTREAWYLALNPNALVPTVVDDGFVLWESNTIIRYYASAHGERGICPTDLRARALMEQWMDWELSVANRAMVPVYRQLIRTAPENRDQRAIEADLRVWASAMAVLDGQLAKSAYVAGASFTLADISLGPITYRWFSLAIERPSLPGLAAWHERLKERPAFQRHVMIELA